MNDTLAPLKGASADNSARARFVLTLLMNMVPLAGVMFWGWSAFELIFLYWLENVVIGVRVLISMLLSGRRHGYVAAIATSMFFTVHYGLFCFVHGMFVIAIFGGANGANPADATPFTTAIGIGFIAIVAWQLALLAIHVASNDESTAPELMFSPYPRIIVLHITILGGGFLLMALNWPQAGIVVLAILKTVMDGAITLFGWKMHTDKKPDSKATLTPPPSSWRP
ncbi:MAG: DUF6498-containing protein [Beijerinckiaceae bacterium]